MYPALMPCFVLAGVKAAKKVQEIIVESLSRPSNLNNSGSSKHGLNDGGLIKDDHKKSRIDAESADGTCKTKKEKKALIGSIPKGKAFDSTVMIRETSVEENDFMIVISRGKRCAW